MAHPSDAGRVIRLLRCWADAGQPVTVVRLQLCEAGRYVVVRLCLVVVVRWVVDVLLFESVTQCEGWAAVVGSTGHM